MKEVLTKRFWQGVKKTFDEAMEDPPRPESKPPETPVESKPKTPSEPDAPSPTPPEP